MIEEKTLEELIEPAWLPTYAQEREGLYRELIELNTTVFILGKIENFPFKLFVPFYDDRIFWQVARNALVERVLMIAWRVIVDTDGDTLTLRRFKKNVWRNALPDGQLILKAALKQVDFENRLHEIAEKVKHNRHTYLAHYNYEANIDLTKTVLDQRLDLNDFKNIVGIARDLFDVLCFMHHHSLWLWGYSDNIRAEAKTDIDELLNNLARNSEWFNMPETDPELWRERSIELTENERKQFNFYRAKLGFTEVE